MIQRIIGTILAACIMLVIVAPTAQASDLPCKNGGSLTSEIKCLAPKLHADKAEALKVYNCETGPNAPEPASQYIGAWQITAAEYKYMSNSEPGWVKDIIKAHKNLDHAGSGYGSTLAVLSWNKWSWSSCA